jgi:hypothetical protein
MMSSLRVNILCALCALAILTCTINSSAQSFEIKRYDNIYGSNTINRGDFNNDGILDVVVGNNGVGSDVTVYLGNADGTLQPPILTDLGSVQPQDFAIGDFNHDGNLDIAIADYVSQNVSVLLGKGDGTFQTPLVLGTKYSVVSVATADFNNDGVPDLAVGEASYDPNIQGVEIFQGLGNGQFNAIGFYQFVDTNTVAKVRAGDFNQDGKIDLAFQLLHSVNVLWGGGDGTFRSQQLGTYVETNDMNTGDLNQDGKTDILVSYYDQIGGAPSRQKFATKRDVMEDPLNGGVDAYFGSSGQQVTRGFIRKNVVTSQYESPAALWAVDIDGDGIADIVALNNNENWHNGLYVWMGNPDGTFQQTPLIFTYTTDRDKTGMIPGDFNRDGRIDFVALRVGTGSLQTLLNATPRSACHARTGGESITVCQPQDDAFSNSPIQDVAHGTGSNITAMQVYIDNKLVKTTSGNNMNASFSLATGDHFVVNKAWNALGQSFRSDRHITIFTGVAGQTCGTNFGGANDTLNLCLPQNNMVDKGSIRVFANAYTETVQTAMQVYIDNQLKLSDSTSSFVDQTYSESPGQHTVVVKAWDADGHNVSKSAVVTVQ